MARIIPLGASTTTAGAVVPLVSSATLTTVGDGFNTVLVQALPGNTGPIYITNASAAPNTTTYANVVGVLSDSTSYQVYSGSGQVNDTYAGQFFAGPSVSGEGWIVIGRRN